MPSNFQPYLKDRVYHPIIIKKVSGVFFAHYYHRTELQLRLKITTKMSCEATEERI